MDGTKVTVSWVTGTDAADTISYREVGSRYWVTKRLRPGQNSYTFSGRAGSSYEIKIDVDRTGVVLTGECDVLAKPKLDEIDDSITDESISVRVTNYHKTNLKDTSSVRVSLNGRSTVVEFDGTATFSNGAKVSFDSKHGILVFTNLKSDTDYKIAAAFINETGSSEMSKSISEETEDPAFVAPELLTVEVLSDSEVKLTWTESLGRDSNCAAEKYRVEYSTNGGKKWRTAVSKVRGTSVIVDDLESATEYMFRVYALEDSGFEDSAVSNTLTATTMLPTPKILKVDSKKSGTATIKWKVEENVESIILSYSELKSEDPAEQIVITGKTVEKGKYTVTGLTSGAAYQFQIQLTPIDTTLENSPLSKVAKLFRVK